MVNADTAFVDVVSAVPWSAISDVTVVGIVVFFITAFIADKVLTRKTADNEKAAIVAGYEYKDQAHTNEVNYKNEQIDDLKSQARVKDELLERREAQLSTVLNEMASTLAAWERATREAVRDEEDTNAPPP